MEFEFTAEQRAFRRELRDFLAEQLDPQWRGVYGSNGHEMIPMTRRVCEELAARGWLTLSWPGEFGGGDGDLWSQMVLR
ncbi:MAG: acyl-CoA dehydrogenase family protein, partial [Aeromicrobium sp.]